MQMTQKRRDLVDLKVSTHLVVSGSSSARFLIKDLLFLADCWSFD